MAVVAQDTSRGGKGEPADHIEAVSPSDTDELTHVSRALWVGGAGNMVVVTVGGETVTITAIPAGTLLPIRVKQVKSGSLTASAILNLY
jgi:hypothetical protein